MSFKDRLQSDDVLRGVLSVIPSSVVTQAVAAAGADFVLIDREHGAIGRETMHAMIAATAGTECTPLVRVPAIEESEVKLALDMGAEGVVFPLVRTAADAARCVELVTYPPGGLRGFGPFIAHSRHQVPLNEYLGTVAPQITCGLLLETVEAVENIDQILAVPGVDYVVMAQFDLSTAFGVSGRFDAPVFVDAVTTIEAAVFAAGIPLGGAAFTPEVTSAMIGKGYRVLYNGFDVLMLAAGVRSFATWN
jgi:4-hydroxy-2-oxoheptanedioate aldolase